MAPTYFRREPGIERSDGRRGSAQFWRDKARIYLFSLRRGGRAIRKEVDALSLEKAELRRAAQARRDALPADWRKAAAEAIAACEFPLAIAPGTIVSGFMPLKSEINPLPLMRKLADAGASLALPAVAGPGWHVTDLGVLLIGLLRLTIEHPRQRLPFVFDCRQHRRE